MLTLNNIQAVLETRPFRFLERANSTNDIALMWLQEGAEHGAVVITDEQIQGRGRSGRFWYTPAGTALIVSIILHPEPRYLSRVSMMGALAVWEVIHQLGVDTASIKWPNDVQIDGLKVCGVLPEAVWEGDQLRGVVLGIGINVRIDFTQTPLANTAISLETVLGKKVHRLDLLVDLLARLDYWSGHMDMVLDAWKIRLTTLGQHISSGQIEGLAEDIDNDGALIIRDGNGRVHRVIAGDIGLGDGR